MDRVIMSVKGGIREYKDGVRRRILFQDDFLGKRLDCKERSKKKDAIKSKLLGCLLSGNLQRSEFFAVDVSHDHVGNRLAGPLWSHVANTLNSDELKAIIGLSVT